MALVFKVKFQDTLRRWVATEALNADDSFSITFGQLEAKIKELFHLTPSASLAITYVDNDNDVVTLADDQDLIDACVVQRLNPLRLHVQVLVGGNSNSSEGVPELPRSSDPPMSSENVNLEAFLNALFPQATADAVKGFLRTYTPFIDPKLPADFCLAKAENAFKEFLTGLAAHHPAHPKFVEKFAPRHPNKYPCPAMSSPHRGDTSVHWNIECDGCGTSPIEGSRYKSIKKFNYDLCGSCFKTMGNENDYEKLDQPVHHPPYRHYRSPCFKRGPRPFPAPPGCRASFARGPYGWKPNHPFTGHQTSGSSASDEHKKLDARFVKDVTIFDGTELSPGTKFTKIWRISNIGTLPWPRSTQLVHIGGDVLCAEETVALELPEGGLPCGEEVEVSVDLTAPEKPGRYVSHWRLTTPFGQKFGHRVWVVIHVVPKGEHSPQFQASLQNGKSSVEVNKEAMDLDLDHTNTGTMDVDLNGANKVFLDLVYDCETAQLSVGEPRYSDHENAQPLLVYPDPSLHSLKDVGMSTENSVEVGANTSVVYPDPSSHDLQDVSTFVEQPDPSPHDLKDVGMSTEKSVGVEYPDPSPHGLKDVGVPTEKSVEVGVNTLVVYPDPTSHDVQDVDMSTEKPLEGGGDRKYELDGFYPISHDVQDVDMSTERGADRKYEVDGFSLVEKPTESSEWFEVDESERFYSPEGPKEGEEVAQASLLQALESMGFADHNVNIAILQSRNFVLQDAVDDLLAAAGWNGVLKDLEEMGFNDKASNVRLLVKNKGSLKQTVRDLVKLEKAVVEG